MKIDDKVILELEKEGISEEFFTAKRIYRKKGKLISEEVVPTPTKKHSKSFRLLSYIMLFIGIIGLGVGIWKGLGNNHKDISSYEKYYIEELNISKNDILILYSNELSITSRISVAYIKYNSSNYIYINYFLKTRGTIGVDDYDFWMKVNDKNENNIPVTKTVLINLSDYTETIDKEYITIEYQYYDVNYKFKLYIDYEQLQINLANKYTE